MLLKNYKVSEQPYELQITPSPVPAILGLVALPIIFLIFFRDFFAKYSDLFDLHHLRMIFQRDPFYLVIFLLFAVMILFDLIVLLKSLILGKVKVDRVARSIFKNSQSVATFGEIDKISVKKPLLSRTATLSVLLRSGKTIKLLKGNNLSELKEIAQKVGTMAGIAVEST